MHHGCSPCHQSHWNLIRIMPTYKKKTPTQFSCVKSILPSTSTSRLLHQHSTAEIRVLYQKKMAVLWLIGVFFQIRYVLLLKIDIRKCERKVRVTRRGEWEGDRKDSCLLFDS